MGELVSDLFVDVLNVAGDPIIELEIPATELVFAVKQRILACLGFSPYRQRLLHESEFISDTDPLATFPRPLGLTMAVLDYEVGSFSSLMVASGRGDATAVDEALRLLADPNCIDENDLSPLFIAACNGHLDVVKLLVADVAEPDIIAQYDQTPLCVASQHGHAQIVRFLCERGADKNLVDVDCWSPLHLAAQNGHLDVVEILCEEGAYKEQIVMCVHLPPRQTYALFYFAEPFGRTVIRLRTPTFARGGVLVWQFVGVGRWIPHTITWTSQRGLNDLLLRVAWQVLK